jgi:hypothetical protein
VARRERVANATNAALHEVADILRADAPLAEAREC